MINLQDILQAKKEIADIIHTTPVLESKQLSELSGNHLYFKAEHLQKTGSFKIRGAANMVSEMAKEKAPFLTAASSGNHGQAVAYMANHFGIPATIVVPEDVNPSKQKAIEAYGGTIEKCGYTSEERIQRAEDLAKERGGVFIPPYNDKRIIAGQGTVGLEILEQVPHADIVVVPIGGGGLIAGVLTAIKQSNPKIKVIGVEPELANDTYLSLKNEKLTEIAAPNTIADGLRTLVPGYMTFPIVQEYIDEIVLVTEKEIKQAQQLVLERMKQLIEPSGAVSVAAAISGKLGVQDKHVVCVLSGGNIDIGKLNI
ncbi:threonine ammonia-lyase [Oceanobacillus sp. CAU 1775]